MQTNVLLSSSNGIQPPILHRHRCSTPVRRTLPHLCPWWAWSVHNFTVDNSYTNTAYKMRSPTPMSANIVEAIQKGVRANIKMQLVAFYEESATSSFSKSRTSPLPSSRFPPYRSLCWWASKLSDLSWCSGQWCRALRAGRGRGHARIVPSR
jgi:hypothetical protein